MLELISVGQLSTAESLDDVVGRRADSRSAVEQQTRCVLRRRHGRRTGCAGVPGSRFFGRPASTLPVLAVLTQRTGAPVVPVFTHRQADGGHVIEIQPALPFEEPEDRDRTLEHNTQRYTTVIEAAIRRHPEQWTWIHKRWKGPQLVRTVLKKSMDPTKTQD